MVIGPDHDIITWISNSVTGVPALPFKQQEISLKQQEISLLVLVLVLSSSSQSFASNKINQLFINTQSFTMAPTRVRSAKEKETNRLTQQRKRDAKREAKMEREELKKRGIVDKAAEEAELEEKAKNALRQRKFRAKKAVSKSKRVSPCAVDVLGYVFRSALRLAGLV